jgi:citrate synthase
LLTGELPTGEQRDLLDALFVALSNPGPRHPATRAAMNAGVARTQLPHILPVGLSILGGEHLGGGEVIRSMKWIREWRSENAKTIAEKCLQAIQSEPEDWHVAPGFGTRFGSRDKLTERVAETLLDLPAAGRSLEWCEQFVTALQAFDEDMGWLPTGLAAAAFLDLGLPPRAGAGLFQLACAPGLLAHGVEMSEGPSTGMPFIDEEHYIIE